MSDNRENNFNPFPPKTFWPAIADYLENLLCQCDLEVQKIRVHQWYDAFLTSDDADDYTLRTECLLQRNNLLNLITILQGYHPKKRAKQLKKFLENE